MKDTQIRNAKQQLEQQQRETQSLQKQVQAMETAMTKVIPKADHVAVLVDCDTVRIDLPVGCGDVDVALLRRHTHIAFL